MKAIRPDDQDFTTIEHIRDGLAGHKGNKLDRDGIHETEWVRGPEFCSLCTYSRAFAEFPDLNSTQLSEAGTNVPTLLPTARSLSLPLYTVRSKVGCSPELTLPACTLTRKGSLGTTRGSRGTRAQCCRRSRFPGGTVWGVSGGAREHQGGNAGGYRAHGGGSAESSEQKRCVVCVEAITTLFVHVPLSRVKRKTPGA